MSEISTEGCDAGEVRSGSGGGWVRPDRTTSPLPSVEGSTSRFELLLPESKGRNLALTVLNVPCSLDSEGPSGLHHVYLRLRIKIFTFFHVQS